MDIKMPECLIVSLDADEFAREITRLAGVPITFKVSSSVEQARRTYTNESVLLGDPDMIARVLPDMARIAWVQSSWAGVTPLIALGRRDYLLTGVKGVFDRQVSEYVIGYLLAHELKLVRRAREQRKHNWFEAGSGTLEGKRLGIMGTGTIARHLAAMAKPFGLTVTGLSRSGASAPGFENVMRVEQLDEFLPALDYLVAILPQTDETDNLLDAASLALLPAHAYFINVGRSNVVDDLALLEALNDDKLAGAALDVFDEEPIPQGSPLWDNPKMLITAHIAALSNPSLIVPIFLENYHRYIRQQPLKYLIDFDAGY